MQTLWDAVDDYFGERLLTADPALLAALEANGRADLPAVDVSPLQGQFLALLVRLSGARRILEIGTLGGYSTIWFARAVGEAGRVVTLEVDPHHAEVARANLANAGLAERVEVITGPALDSLPQLADRAPFDVVFIDADKPNNPDYLAWALRLSRPGTVIVVDNVVREGRVTRADSRDPSVQGVRRMTDMMAAEPRLTATVLQTVGAKGYDGFAIAVVD